MPPTICKTCKAHNSHALGCPHRYGLACGACGREGMHAERCPYVTRDARELARALGVTEADARARLSDHASST